MKKILFTLIASLFILASCGAERLPVDIINPDAEYLYFFGGTCPHCQELNRIANDNDLYSKISIEKREVYANTENQAMFLELIDELGVEGSGVPFVYDKVTGEVAVGVKPALELMTSRLGQEPVDTITDETHSSDTMMDDTMMEEETEEDEVTEETGTGTAE
jgi:hypothetical protein